MGRVGTVVIALALATGQGQTAPATNLLLIVTDNQSPGLLGAYGNPVVRTPNIDQLAAEGMLFNRAFSATGVCSPSRAAMMTGLMPSQNGVHNGLPAKFDIADYSAIEEFRNLPQTLADAGYQTAMIGKHHLGVHDRPQLGYQHWVTFLGGHTGSFTDATIFDNGESYDLEQTGLHMTDFWTVKAIEFLEQRDGERPFFMMLSYNGPYILPPTVNEPPTNRFAEIYARQPPPLPQEPVHPYLRDWAKNVRMNLPGVVGGSWPWAAIDALNNRAAMVNIAAETTLVDDGIGRVLKALQDADLESSTLVVFTSDQGSAYGQLGLWGNSSWGDPSPAFNANMQIPLILRHPSRISPSKVSDAMIRQVDLLPTLLDYLGLGHLPIANSPGRSFVPLLDNEPVDWEQTVFWEYIATRVIQTERWKYVKRFQPDRNELYDLSADPEQRRNVIDKADTADIATDLDEKLSTFFARYSKREFDPWQGGTGKALLFYSKRDNAVFAQAFPQMKEPFVAKGTPFRDR